jgi:hypothetical protein
MTIQVHIKFRDAFKDMREQDFDVATVCAHFKRNEKFEIYAAKIEDRQNKEDRY